MNISMARQWHHKTYEYFQYSQDRELAVWRIKRYLRDEHGYVMVGLNNPQNPTEKT